MNGPSNWVTWLADLGSIFGFVATIILALQAGSAKKKYQRLIKLSRHSVYLNRAVVELRQLIEEYAISPAGIQGWLGPASDHLKALSGECKGNDQRFVNDVLGNVRTVKGRVTQEALIQVYRDLSEISVMVERIAEDAKINA